MTAAAFEPPWAGSAAQALGQLAAGGHAVLAPGEVRRWADLDPLEVATWPAFWDALPLDGHLLDGGRYRRRRHGSLRIERDATQPDGWRLEAVAPRAHWQPVEYNALHGGLERWYEPPDPAWLGQGSVRRLLARLADAGVAIRGEGAAPWFCEIHPFRIDTANGIGRPTPEGAHRDGVDLVAVMLAGREGVKGGETRVFAAAEPRGLRYTLTQPLSLVLLDDARMIHETTPIQAWHGDSEPPGHRDTLVVTLRSGGFLGPG